MRQYLDLLQDILDNGSDVEDRTGTGTRSVFGRQLRFDLTEGFPLLTTKRVFFRGLYAELLWMLSGDTNVNTLKAQRVHIWDEWADQDGELGPVYGAQWRGFGGVDQIEALLEGLRSNPDSRRHVVSAWNPAELPQMALAPCHCLFQCRTRPLEADRLASQLLDHSPERFSHRPKEAYAQDPADLELWCESDGLPTRALDLQMYQRSSDVFLGVPFNIASYALLTHMLASVSGFAVGEYVHTFGDVHIYNNHFDQVRTQLARTPGKLPTVDVNPRLLYLDDFGPDDVKLVGYEPQAPISAPVSV